MFKQPEKGRLQFRDRNRLLYRLYYVGTTIHMIVYGIVWLLFPWVLLLLLAREVFIGSAGQGAAFFIVGAILLVPVCTVMIRFGLFVHEKWFGGGVSPFITSVHTKGISSFFFIPNDEIQSVTITDHRQCLTFYFLKVTVLNTRGKKLSFWVNDTYRFFVALRESLGEERFRSVVDKAWAIEGLIDGSLLRKDFDDCEKLVVHHLVYEK